METSVKKFFTPTLYPLDRNPQKTWFIKYKVKNYATGRLDSKKYYGALNIVPDCSERIELAEQYILQINSGQLPNSYQGMKRLRTAVESTNFSSLINCCYKYVEYRKHELDKRTISQYRSRINMLSQWLISQNISDIAIGGLTKENARDFLNFLKSEKCLSNKTYNEYKSLFKCIWKEHLNDGHIKHNPWASIKSLAEETKHFTSYPEQLRQYIKSTLPNYDKQLWLFMQTIYYCAIRPHSELRKMKVCDLIVEKQRFIVRKEISKGAMGKKKERVVNIYTGLFIQYIEQQYHNYPSDYYLFSYNNTPGAILVPQNYFINKWNAYKKQFGIPEQYKLYGSKHTAGKRLSFIFNEFVTKEHFGHSSLESTRQYTENIDKDELNILQTNYPEF